MKHQTENMERHLAELIACRTTADNKSEIARCFGLVETMLAGLPLIAHYYEKNGSASMVWTTEEALEFDYILSGHIDVVPGPDHLYQLQAVNGRLIGRGVSDMKFAIPVYAEVLHHIYRETGQLPSLAIMLTSDEEDGGEDGTGYLVNEIGYRARMAAIIPDGGDGWHVVEEAKGVLQLKISVGGMASHAGEPWSGENAIIKMAPILAGILQRYPESKEQVWATTLNLSQLHAGSQNNQVPDTAELCLDIRYTPDVSPEDLIAEIQALAGDAEVSVLIQADSFKTDINHPAVGRWIELIRPHNQGEILTNDNGASDGRYFTAKGIPTIVSLPNCGEAHADEEWLGKEAMHHFAMVLLQYLSGAECPA